MIKSIWLKNFNVEQIYIQAKKKQFSKYNKSIALDEISVKTLYHTLESSETSDSTSSSSLANVEAPMEEVRGEVEEQEEAAQRSDMVEREGVSQEEEEKEEEKRLRVVSVGPSSAASSHKTSSNSDTSGSSVLSKDTHTGYLTMDSSSGCYSGYKRTNALISINIPEEVDSQESLRWSSGSFSHMTSPGHASLSSAMSTLTETTVWHF